MSRSRLVQLLVALSVALAPMHADAQLRPPRRRPPTALPPPKPKPPSKPPPKAKPPSAPGMSLKSKLGIAVTQRLLKSTDKSDRVRALERLGAVATPPALESLSKSLETGGAAKTFEERLIAVRGLAPHTTLPVARQGLSRALTASGRPEDVAETLVRETAALALARSGDKDALELLGKALRQEGPIAQAAVTALEAHPPKDIAPILGARGAATVALVEALERLGDQRGFSALRALVRFGTPEIRGRAAVALTRLGDFETVDLARQWLARKKDPELRIAAARILALGRASDAPKAIAKLLDDDATQDAALEIALASPSPALVGPISERLKKADPATAPAYLGALGRIGGPEATRVLAAELKRSDRQAAAAYALALAPGSAATDELARALGSAETRRNAARAAVIRELALGESVDGIESALNQLIVSPNAADRAAGAWGHSARSDQRALTIIKRKDPVVVRAAARAALTPKVARAAAERLTTAPDGLTRTALAIGLVDDDAAELVPTALLAELVEEGGAAAPLAAKALAARDGKNGRPQLDLLLKSGDPLIRGHVARGLARSKDPSAVGLLERAYRFEQDADVRYAIVIALSQRHEPTRMRTLALAADLDGNRRVRSAARVARGGNVLRGSERGTGTFWAVLAESGGATGKEHPSSLTTPSGVALPVIADPDGLLSLGNLPAGPVTLRLAAEPDESNAPSP